MTAEAKIIGLNVGGHDGGCALMIGDRIVCAVSEERINRYRYAPGWHSSLLYCLSAAGIKLDDIDLVVFSSYGPSLPLGYDGGLSQYSSKPLKCISVDHHLSHAVGAFALSPFEEALVVVMDGWGNNSDTESFYVANRKGMTRVGGNNPDRPRWKGIGATYEAFTNFLGFPDTEAGKTMGLAAYGDPNCFEVPLYEINGADIRGRLEQTHQMGVARFARENRMPFGTFPPPQTSQIAWQIAAYVQNQTEIAVLEAVRHMQVTTGSSNICLSGGIALNCLINSDIRSKLKPGGLFILPFASDTGQPVGNALYGFWHLMGEFPAHTLRHCFMGKSYDEDEILAGLQRMPGTTRYDRLLKHKFTYGKDSDVSLLAAQLLADGQTLGWFQGGSELGPRALGHRSILADPRSAVVRDVINSKVKHREWFRPFAPSVLLEHSQLYFNLAAPSPFMLEAREIKSEAKRALQATVHVDGTARLQTVEIDQDARFHKLISEFGRISGVNAVLNTSFNDREPIVETPGDALFTFLTTDLDCLIVGDYVVTKQPL